MNVRDEPVILLAEDDDTDVLLMRRALAEVGVTASLQVVTDGQEAIDYLSQVQSASGTADRMPSLLILDLKMPRLTGFDVLLWLREQPSTRGIPTIVLSSSPHQHDIERAYAAGANFFAVKSPSTSERLEFARFLKGWLHFNQLPMACTEGFRAAQSLHATLPMR
jgi:CheY-like chemotaxis protein